MRSAMNWFVLSALRFVVDSDATCCVVMLLTWSSPKLAICRVSKALTCKLLSTRICPAVREVRSSVCSAAIWPAVSA